MYISFYVPPLYSLDAASCCEPQWILQSEILHSRKKVPFTSQKIGIVVDFVNFVQLLHNVYRISASSN